MKQRWAPRIVCYRYRFDSRQDGWPKWNYWWGYSERKCNWKQYLRRFLVGFPCDAVDSNASRHVLNDIRLRTKKDVAKDLCADTGWFEVCWICKATDRKYAYGSTVMQECRWELAGAWGIGKGKTACRKQTSYTLGVRNQIVRDTSGEDRKRRESSCSILPAVDCWSRSPLKFAVERRASMPQIWAAR